MKAILVIGTNLLGPVFHSVSHAVLVSKRFDPFTQFVLEDGKRTIVIDLIEPTSNPKPRTKGYDQVYCTPEYYERHKELMLALYLDHTHTQIILSRDI